MKAQNRFAELQKRVVLIDKRLSTLERAISASARSAVLKTRQEVILQRICSLEGSSVEVITTSLLGAYGYVLYAPGTFQYNCANRQMSLALKRNLAQS